jgi:hypothetical protein
VFLLFLLQPKKDLQKEMQRELGYKREIKNRMEVRKLEWSKGGDTERPAF